MSELVDRAKASLEGVTPGPWRHEIGEEHGETVHFVQWGVESSVGIFTGNYGGASTDAEFIAAARQLVPELIAEVKRLEAERVHWKALWKGTVEDSTKVIQERDEALWALDKVTESWKRLAAGYSDE
ncbi:Bacteriophage protein [Mycobacteroides abscessus subsp. massiliense]|nr:hypothetical protein [Mycobacteroides abscessus]SKM17271.1 Bacteriophage protein [Mycobacteroides abscessus subsp. massiliense]MDM2426942.1 hypothetical protein [Mycobacteroides abscessus]MDM2431727.1 hypothetical protein [Mycobacteroides abscessus]MDM2436660.1 hypothetical protein [Mycobacteroides abscessus]